MRRLAQFGGFTLLPTSSLSRIIYQRWQSPAPSPLKPPPPLHHRRATTFHTRPQPSAPNAAASAHLYLGRAHAADGDGDGVVQQRHVVGVGGAREVLQPGAGRQLAVKSGVVGVRGVAHGGDAGACLFVE